MIGAPGGSAIATLVEHSSRYVMLGHLGRERSADAVRDSLIATVTKRPDALRGHSPGTKVPRWPIAPSRSRPTWTSTSATPEHPGNPARRDRPRHDTPATAHRGGGAS